MKEGQRHRMHSFLLRWVVLCALGLSGGLASALALAAPIEAIVGMMLVTPIVFAIAGSMFGAVQWLALGKKIHCAAFWIGASAIGLGVGLTLGIVAVELLGRAITGEQVRLLAVGSVGRALGLTLVGTITGLAVGATQRIALRAHATVGAGWILKCVLGFGVGLPLGGLVAGLANGSLSGVIGIAIFLGVAGVVVGVVTARAAGQIAARSVHVA